MKRVRALADLGVNLTDRRMKALTERLDEVYGEAYKTAVDKNKTAIAKLTKVKEELKSGKYDDVSDQIKEARLRSYTMQVIRTENIANNIAAEIAKSGETAAGIIRGEMTEVFALNYDFTNYDISRQAKINYPFLEYPDDDKLPGNIFNQYDKNQIAVLVQENESPFTKIAYNRLGDSAKNANPRRLQNELIAATINGESQSQIMARIKKVTGQNNSSARRIAQTERTRVQTQARHMSIKEAEAIGIGIDKQWVARLINTRESHVHVHLQVVRSDEKFSNGLEYPGDPSGGAAEVINCFCYLKPMVRSLSKALAEHRDRIYYMTMSFDEYLEKVNSSKINEKEHVNSEMGDIIDYKALTKPEINELQKQSDDVYKNKLTTDELVALTDYVGDGYEHINTYLYSENKNSALIQDKINQIDSAMDKFSLDKDIIVYRGTAYQYYTDWEVGGVKKIDAYLSSAVTKEKAQAFYDSIANEKEKPVMMEISVPKGTKGIYVGDNNTVYGSEDELILGRGLTYKVLEFTENLLRLEVIP